MTGALLTIDAALCALMAARLLAFRKRAGHHLPRASALAYLLIVAAAAVPLLALFGQTTLAPRLVIDAVLCAAVWAVRGNVLELFRRSDENGGVAGMLEKRTWF